MSRTGEEPRDEPGVVAVVRPIADPLVTVPGIAGAAELGDGSVCLILDAAAVAQLARARLRKPTRVTKTYE